jgi:hypothetical protein
MIPKKASYSNDPKNYRPISLISCVGKLIEKIVKVRLVTSLDLNNALVTEQSGFRSNRRTTDNLLYLTQKTVECFNRGKNCLTVFFDIAKAFDRVWHNGLIFKLIQLKIPNYMIIWIKDYLNNRKFFVKLGEQSSCTGKIETGVPQGGVLSPILFSIFINDIPIRNELNKSNSVLFADDLATFFYFNKIGNLNDIVNKYLKEIEKWLVKWKFKMSANKCCFIIFSKGSKKNELKLNLKLFNEIIPNNPNPVFLGVQFDEKLNFDSHIELLKKNKINNRLNLIKILSHRKWKLSHSTLLTIYYSLIRSLFDYIFFIINSVPDSSIVKIQRIQNSAIKNIFHCPPYTNLSNLESSLGVSSIVNRLTQLNLNYLNSCILNNNPLINKLINEYKNSFQSRLIKYITPICSLRNSFFN